MDSRTAIYNRVLIHLGITGQIEHYNAKTVEATTITDVYDVARDYVLKDFDWNFAMRYCELSLAKEYNSPNVNGYMYEYHYPPDCIAARSLYLKGDNKDRKFKTGLGNDNRMVIYADVCPAILRYTKRIDVEKVFTPDFEMAFSLYIASLVAEALTGQAQKADRLLQKYELFKRHSAKINANEDCFDDEDNSTYIDKRF